MPTKPDKSRQPRRWKPLSPAQETALTLYMAGQSDQQVADTLGVCRQTCWEWRNQHLVFMHELAKRRGDLWRSVTETLRAGLSKAVENLMAAVNNGDLKASLELLKCCDIYANGHMNSIYDTDPDRKLDELIAKRLEAEQIPQTERDALGMMLNQQTTAYTTREAQIRAELESEYCETE